MCSQQVISGFLLIPVDFALIFFFFVVYQTVLPKHKSGTDWDSFLAVGELQDGSHRWRKDPKGRETLCSHSYYTCRRNGHALINGEESWGEKGQKVLWSPLSPMSSGTNIQPVAMKT